jgi:hypothetical protein
MAMLWSSGVPNLTEVLTNFLGVVARFLEWVAVAGLTELLESEGKIATMATMLVVVVGIAELVQRLTVGSRTAAARSSEETGLAWRMQCSLVLFLVEFLPRSSLFLGTLRCCGLSHDTGNRSEGLLGCDS